MAAKVLFENSRESAKPAPKRCLVLRICHKVLTLHLLYMSYVYFT